MTINMTDKYQTRDGREVRIYAVDGAGEYSIHGAIKAEMGWSCALWRGDGLSVVGISAKSDLIPVRRSGWLNIYPDCSIYATRIEADATARADRIACIHVEFNEGEGLEGSCSQK